MERRTIVGVNSIACFPEPRKNKHISSYELHVDTSFRSNRQHHRHRDYSFGTGWVLKINYGKEFDFAFGRNVYLDAYNASSNLSELYGICETIRQLKDECHINFKKIPLKIFCDNQKAAYSIIGNQSFLEKKENSEFKYCGKLVRADILKISKNHSVHWMKGHRPEDNFENHLADKIAKELRYASEEHNSVLGKFHLLTLIHRALGKTHTDLIDTEAFLKNSLRNFSQINSFLEEDNAVILDTYTTAIKHKSPFKSFWTIKDSRYRYRGNPILSKKTIHEDSVEIFISDIIDVLNAYKRSPFFDQEKTIYLHSESLKYHLDSLHATSSKKAEVNSLYRKLLYTTFGLNIIPTGLEVNHDVLISGEVHRVLKTEKNPFITKRAMKTYKRITKI